MDSVGGLLVLLHEENDILRGNALNKLHNVVDSHWSEILEQIENIETLASADEFQHQKLAAAVASKCFYHLEEYNYSLQYALRAGEYFDVKSNQEYEVTIVGKCIEAYIELNKSERDEKQLLETLDEEGSEDEALQLLELKDDLERIVEGLFEKCYSNGNFEEALGIALEAHKLEKVRTTIQRSGAMKGELLSSCLSYCLKLVKNKDFRSRVMEVLVTLYEEEEVPNFLQLATVLHSLHRVKEFSKLLLDLVRDDEGFLVAYQIAFDLMELQDQKFVGQLLALLPKVEEGEANPKVQQLLAILGGGKATAVYLDFLYHNNATDTLILKDVKTAIETGRKNSVLHNATMMMHAFAQSGTTVDSFFRNDNAFVSQASNWAKFSATATIGMIHKGNVTSSMTVLDAFLPKETSVDAFSEGGALYAIGLIHALEGAYGKSGKDALDYLNARLIQAQTEAENHTREAHQHGACLGLGLVAMSSGDVDLATMLFRDVVNRDSAVSGESAALGVGMVLLGGGVALHRGLIDDMLAYAVNTKHEKITRALGLGVAMIMYGQEEEADVLIEQLCGEKDALLRYGGMYVVGLAYCGSANNTAIRRLLKVAVSDVNNDVRRAAVTNLGFVLLNQPERLPSLIELLSESYNPHVRYGSAMALGIACNGLADPKEAVVLLQALIDDKVDFVRQSAMLSMSMLLMQSTPEKSKVAKEFREKLADTVSDIKHSSTMTRMGAILSLGLIDAGGRNAHLGLISRSGVPKPPAVVGMALFCQYWYWYPLMHCIALSLQPTCLVGLNADLEMPNDFKVDCSTDLSEFAYPLPRVLKKEKKQQKVATAVLSMTAKAKAAAAAKDKDVKMEVEQKEEKEEEKKEEKTPEQLEEERLAALKNPIRVTKKQQNSIVFVTGRFMPVANDGAHKSGIVMLRDTDPGAPSETTKISAPPTTTNTTTNATAANNTVQPPGGFVFHPQ